MRRSMKSTERRKASKPSSPRSSWMSFQTPRMRLACSSASGSGEVRSISWPFTISSGFSGRPPELMLTNALAAMRRSEMRVTVMMAPSARKAHEGGEALDAPVLEHGARGHHAGAQVVAGVGQLRVGAMALGRAAGRENVRLQRVVLHHQVEPPQRRHRWPEGCAPDACGRRRSGRAARRRTP